MGIRTEIKLTNESISYNHYDLLHFFNLTRPADILFHIRRAALPFVVSTILIDYSEYDKYHRRGLSQKLFRYFSSDAIEYMKVIFRWLKGNDNIVSLSYLLRGQNKSVLEIIRKADLLLPNSNSEYTRLTKMYSGEKTHLIIPNAVDGDLFRFNKDTRKDPGLVLCVARIEGIKNQLNLIHALKNTRFKLLISGSHAPNQRRYYKACRDAATENIHFIEQMPQEELVAYYREAKIHVLPSWFETTGLSSMEAASMGCNIVITDRGDTREYFGNHATYCSPDSPVSIYEAVERASILTGNEALRIKIARDYTWQKAGLNTARGYKKILYKTWDLKLPFSEQEEYPIIMGDSNI
jgi:glycosyltransferase involved in cell wall biosynthesis